MMPIELNLHRPPPFSGDLKPVFQKEALSQTDLKTYAVVVLSYLLIAVGVILAGSFLYMATIVHPMVAMASPAVPLVLGVLGLSSSNPSEMLFAAPSPSWEKGQPLGLNNAGANCWVNAAFQVCAFKFLPLLLDVERKFSRWDAGRDEVNHFTKVHSLLMALQRYHEEIEAGGDRKVSSVNTQEIRAWLAKIYPEVPTKASEQWDAMVFFDALLGGIDFALPMQRRTDRQFANGVVEKGEDNPYVGAHSLVLNMTKGGENRFGTLLEECFEESFEGTVGLADINDKATIDAAKRAGATEVTATHTIRTRFSEAPKTLLIQARRFNKDFDKQGNVVLGDEKLVDEIKFPTELKLSKEQCPSGHANYDVDAIVIQSGTINGGHYYGYIRRDDGRWYKVNDSSVQAVNEEEIQKALPNAYIVHYSKKEEAS